MNFDTHARQVALCPDGILVLLSTDGAVWLYSPITHAWICLPCDITDLDRLALTVDGTSAVVSDTTGRIIWLDLESAKQLLREQGD